VCEEQDPETASSPESVHRSITYRERARPKIAV
jgi:hypothetical protein